MAESHIDRAEGVGGRLSAPKSPAYRRALSDVEARAAPFVLRFMLGSDIAYVLSSAELGYTPAPAARALLAALLDLLTDAERLAQTPGRVDVLVQREAWVAERAGTDAADWLHFGRNRGESIRGYLPRMYFKHALWRDRLALLDLLDALLERAIATVEAPAPVYHHLQHAGVTTLGEWLLSYAGNLAPHIGRIDDALRRIDVAPPVMSRRPALVALGEAVRRRLGFGAIARRRQQIHVTEDHIAEPLFALVLLNVDEARLAEDLRLYSTAEFGYFEVADRHASGSSELPQKKNPFGLQAVIGGAAMGVGRLAGQLAANVSLSEELDSIFQAGSAYLYADDAVAYTEFMAEVLRDGRFDLDRLRQRAGHNFGGAAEVAYALVFDGHVPFRAMHHLLGATVRARRDDPASVAEAEAALRAAAPGLDFAQLRRILEGEEIPDYCIDAAGARAFHAELRAVVDRARAASGAMSPPDAALASLVAEARAWLAR